MKRTNSIMGDLKMEKASIHCSDRYTTFAEAVKAQNNIISTNAPGNEPTKVARRRLSSFEAVTSIPKPPSAVFPQTIAENDAVISPPIFNELKWTTEYSSPGEVLRITEDPSFTNALTNWRQISFIGVKSLPQGTWIQYTSNIFPDYTKRKKTVCIIGENLRTQPDELTVWSLFRKDGSSANLFTSPTTTMHCRRGSHLISLRPRVNSNFMECDLCNCKGWKLTQGSASQGRLFYASPWSISNNDKTNE